MFAVTRPASRVSIAVTLALALANGPVFAVELPVPCAVGVCGAPGVASWVTVGAASMATSGNTLTVTQTTNNATYNWQSFNIGPGGVVRFDQPDETSVALNRIFQADPARILGQLSSNGRVYLLNRNGILFGQGAQVDVRGLVASSLDLSPEALQLGIARAASVAAPAFQPFTEGGVALASGAVTVEQGASIRADGGQVLIFAPEVTNRGTISTPDGQTILAAGQRIFLVASDSTDLRGLLVEVGDGGTVTNGPADANAGSAAALAGRISADRGNVTLAGLAVNQNGRISATTSIRANGSIRLVARDTQAQRLSDTNVLEFSRSGSLTLGANSITEVTLDQDPSKTVDVNAQPVSTVDLWGKDIALMRGARITATAGRVTATAATSREGVDAISATPDASRFTMAAGAVIDVSGAVVDLPMERNSLRVELRGSQLADSPVQRDGPLRSETVYVDIRQSGTRADGSFWRGTPLADLSGDLATISRDVRERSLNAGSVVIQSQGTVILDNDATINLAGGHINWQSGYVRSSQLLGADGRVYGMAVADRDRQYQAVLDNQSQLDPRWGVAAAFSLAGYDPRGNFEPGYVEGKDAGSLAIVAPRIFTGAHIDGTVVNGPNQRLPVQTGASYQPYAAWNVVAKGPSLSFGLVDALPSFFIDYALRDVVFGEVPDLDGIRNADGTPFNPLRDVLPESLATLRLSPSMLAAASPSSLTIAANGSVTLPQGMNLRPPPGASLSIRAGAINVAGSITLPAGTVSLRARQTVVYDNSVAALSPSLHLGPAAVLSLQGQWVNDRWSIDRGDTLLPPVFIGGGNAELLVEDGGLFLDSGSVIDVSGGAQRRADGVVVAGRGGSITLGARQVNSVAASPVALGATLRGFGLREGASLSLAAPSVCISRGACNLPGALRLDPEFFSNGGFRSYSVASNGGGLTMTGGTSLELLATNWVLANAAVTAPSGTSLASLVTTSRLPEDQRRPVSLALSANQSSLGSQAYGDLVIEAGARIVGDAGSTLAFSTNSRMFFGGSVVAPGGTVNFNLSPSLFLDSYRPDQGLWFLAGSSVNVDGRTVLATRQDGRRVGTLLDGGSINVDAARGFVVVQPGANWSANGSRDRLDVQRDDGLFESLDVASRGGAIRIATADGLLFGGTATAVGGGPTAAGGSFSLLIDTRRNSDPNGILPLGSRRILVDTASPVTLAAGASLPASLLGEARVAAPMLQAGGFDFITLNARDTLRPLNVAGPEILATGSVVLGDGVTLSPRGRLVLDASTVEVAGSVRLSSAYVALGSTDAQSQLPVAAVAGSGSLQVESRFTEFFGQLSLAGVAQSRFVAADGVRFTGVFGPAGGDYRARIQFPGDVTFTTSQAYVSTLTDAVVSASGRMMFNSTGTATPTLSAGGRLSLSAAAIDVGTRVAAPGGSLSLAAGEVTVGTGGTLSVSLDGLTPFGRLQGGFAWVYELPDGTIRVYDGTLAELPSKNITIDASAVRVQQGGVIDASGGGDLLAFEFVPGPGGTQDVLAPGVLPGSFAVVPGLDLPFAPVDPREVRGSGLQPGDRVWLDALPGLPAGQYTLLPARYALLPGAVLVTPVAGFGGLRTGTSGSLLDGTPVVAGYRTLAGTPFRDSLTSGFAVRQTAAVAALAHYDVATANDFFPGIEALAATRLPRDAGAVNLLVGTTLDLGGQVRTNAAAAGRGATVAVSADRLRITGTPEDVVPGWVTLLDSQLSALRADTLMLGGRASGGGARASAVATAVEVTGSADVAARRLVLMADGSLVIRSGARLSAQSGSAAAPLQITGGGSFVALDGIAGSPIQLDPAALHGLLSLEAGARLAAPVGGAATLAAAGAPALDGNLALQGAALRVVADNLVLGSGAAVSAGALRADTLAALGLSGLTLESGTQLTLEGAFGARFGELAIRTPNWVLGTPGSVIRLEADRIALGGGNATGPMVGGTGRLELVGGTVTFGSGSTALSGFSDIAVAARDGLLLAGDGSWMTGGNLALSGDLRATTPAGDHAFTVGGDFRLSGSLDPVAPVTLGGGLRIAAANVLVDGAIRLPAGQVRIDSSGNVQLSARALIDVAAPTLLIDSVPIALPGGFVSLTARAGDVTVASGAEVRLAGSSGGAGGEFRASAVNGTVSVDGDVSAGADGTLRLVAGRLALDAALRVASSGFDREVELRQLGVGDWNLAANERLQAQRILLDVEGGSLAVDGTLVANAGDGRIVAVARDRLVLGGSLRAGATGLPNNVDALHSSVLLVAGQGIDVRAGSNIDLAGSVDGGSGELRLRLPEAVVLAAVAGGGGLRLDGSLSNVARVAVEGYRQYSTSVIAAPQVAASAGNPWFAAARAFVTATSGRESALGVAQVPVVFTPGIDVTSSGNLALSADWNLSPWNTLGVAPTVTLRAAGNLLLNRSLSDGFATLTTGASGFALPLVPTDSASYRLVAGAAIAASDPLSVVAGSGGNFVLAPGTPGIGTRVGTQRMVRTGSGSIDIATSGNLLLGNQASVIYTAGVRGSGLSLARTLALGGLAGLAYPERAGDIRIAVGGDLVGAPSTQLFTEWLWKSGARASDLLRPRPTGWSVAFERFEQGIGVFGGGSLRIQSDGNILDLGASVPSIGRQVGSATDVRLNEVRTTGGGSLSVRALGDIRGGTFLIGRGVGELSAGGSIGSSAARNLAPLIGQGDAEVQLSGRADVAAEAVFDPLLLGISRRVGTSIPSHFATFGPDSSIALLSAGGDVRLLSDTALGSTLSLAYPDVLYVEDPVAAVTPPHVDAFAPSGDIRVTGAMTLWPSPSGNLRLLAAGNVDIASQSGGSLQILLSDASVTRDLPTPSQPLAATALPPDILVTANTANPAFYSTTPVHVGDAEPLRIVARDGDIRFQSAAAGSLSLIFSAKRGRFIAGRDILSLGVRLQHVAPGDVTTIQAGRDISYPLSRGLDGRINPSFREITVGGPGELQLIAGRDIDLQTSRGVTSEGNLRNPVLPSGGANVSLTAGAASGAPAYDAFIAAYLAAGSAYDALLFEYVSRFDSTVSNDKAAALARFRALSRDEQRPLLETVLLRAVRSAGRAAAVSPNADFTEAYRALTTFFPGSNPDVDSGQRNPYRGDVKLYFSRVYTLAGGDVRVLSPGGGINAGLAAPPTAYGIKKTASQLGVVVQGTGSVLALGYGDFQVNESRVIAGNGGDILVWSTRGDIDAGRGAKTAISAPPPIITIDETGQPKVVYPAAFNGSGIQTLATTPGVKPGNVDLFAPRGVVNAGDAGIIAGNLTIAATAVLGASNISVSGTAVGVPVDTGGLGASLAGASNAAAGTSKAGQDIASQDAGSNRQAAGTQAEAALNFLDVAVVGLGEDVCRPDDLVCLKNQKKH